MVASNIFLEIELQIYSQKCGKSVMSHHLIKKRKIYIEGNFKKVRIFLFNKKNIFFYKKWISEQKQIKNKFIKKRKPLPELELHPKYTNLCGNEVRMQKYETDF